MKYFLRKLPTIQQPQISTPFLQQFIRLTLGEQAGLWFSKFTTESNNFKVFFHNCLKSPTLEELLL